MVGAFPDLHVELPFVAAEGVQDRAVGGARSIAGDHRVERAVADLQNDAPRVRGALRRLDVRCEDLHAVGFEAGKGFGRIGVVGLVGHRDAAARRHRVQPLLHVAASVVFGRRADIHDLLHADRGGVWRAQDRRDEVVMVGVGVRDDEEINRLTRIEIPADVFADDVGVRRTVSGAAVYEEPLSVRKGNERAVPLSYGDEMDSDLTGGRRAQKRQFWSGRWRRSSGRWSRRSGRLCGGLTAREPEKRAGESADDDPTDERRFHRSWSPKPSYGLPFPHAF